MISKWMLGCIAATTVSLVLAGPALADTRFADPAGPIGAGDCSSAANACDIQVAVESASGGDEVILAPGDYVENDQLTLSVAATVHGAVGQPRPRIVTSANTGVLVFASGSILRRAEIEHTSGGGGTALLIVAGTAEQLVVHTTDGSQAGQLQGDGPITVRDSVFRSTRTLGTAALRVTSNGGNATSATLRNVTASATEANGIGLAIEAIAAAATATATNVIADGGSSDVNAFRIAPHLATATLDHSNYATEVENEAGATVTDPGTGTGNQLGSPLFTNAATGDFHQVFGSPTIDAGVGGAGLGAADLDGEARTQGSAPDIGADEFVPPPTTLPADPGTGTGTPAPTKKCKKGQKLKKGKCVKKKRKKRR